MRIWIASGLGTVMYSCEHGNECEISGIRRFVVEAFALLGCFGALSWLLFTGISGQPISPVFKGQAEDATDRLS